MKIIRGSRRCHYLARVGVFLIMLALIAGMAGCGSGPGPGPGPGQYSGQCSLTIHCTEGGGLWEPGVGTFNYDYGTVVYLYVEADVADCYEFVNWTGDVGTIADVEAIYTTITMHGSYVITANFAPKVSENLEIWDWDDLDAVRDNRCGNHTLMNDLDSTTPGYEELAGPMANGGRGWEPIGFMEEESSFPFKGTFDGQGYEIHDLIIHNSYFLPLGLFGYSGGVIKNIGVVNATVVGVDSLCVGALVGLNWGGTVSNSYSTGNVSGDGDYGCVGGLVGENSGTVSDSYSAASVISSGCIGGLVGSNFQGTVSNSHYNYDEVLINGENIITRGALFGEDFDEWLANDKFLDINDRLSQKNGHYMVNNVADFKELLAFGQDNSLKFRLKNDLDLAAEPNLYIPYFAGEFDGNGHKISNLSFDFDFISHIGLFGYLAPDGKVSQVCVENVNITGVGFVGGLVGDNDGGTVSNSYSTGSVTGERLIGGLVGQNGKYQHGGTVSNSYSTGNVTGNELVGGLVGENTNDGTVSDSYSTGSVCGNEDVGGLVGHNYLGGSVSNSYSSGNVTGDNHVGGLMGYNEGGSVSNSYSSGSVTGDEYVGGLVGRVGKNYYYESTVSNSYSIGSVAGNLYVGGLVGRGYGDVVSNSFWDTETSGQATSDGGTGKTTAEMKNTATFSGAGWNITAVANPGTRNPAYIWNIVDYGTYPFLSWQP